MPISVIFLLSFSAVALVGGVIFVITSLRSSRADETAVPISSLEEIQEIKTKFNENIVEQKKAVSLADHVIKQNLESRDDDVSIGGFSGEKKVLDQNLLSLVQEEKKQLEFQVKSIKEDCSRLTKEYDFKNKELIEENNRLSEALNREVSSKGAITLSEQEAFEMEESKKSLVQLQDSQENLTKENQSLGRLLEEKSAKLNELKDYIDQMTTKVEEVSRMSESKLKLYEDKMLEAQKEKEGLVGSEETFNSLEKQNKSLRDHDDVISARLKRMAQKIVVLKQKNRHFKNEKPSVQKEPNQENQELIYRLKLSEEKNCDLQENIEIVNMRNAQKLNEAHGQIDLLNSQIEGFQTLEKQAQDNEVSEEVDGASTEEFNRLRQENADSVRNFEKIKEFNDHLLEKEKILQYELTKSRAQNLGLEKICEEFKDQIEKTDKIRS